MASFFLDTTTAKRYYLGKAQVEYNGQYLVRPTAQTYTDLGLAEVVIQPRPDDRFYIVTGPDNYGYHHSTNREIEDVTTDGVTTPGLKSQFISKQKDTANKLLATTDWYVLREIETSESTPSEISTFRAAVRSVCAANVALITGISSVSNLEALVNNPATVRETPGDETSSFIDNSEPHLDVYPETPTL